MSTYLSDAYGTPSSITTPTLPTMTGAGQDGVVRSMFTLTLATTQALISGDLLKLSPIPLNYKVSNYFLDFPAVDNSAGILWSLGDNTNSSGIYAFGMTGGRVSAQQFFRAGDQGTVSGTIAAQKSNYNVKHSTRVNKDAADDFILRISASPGVNLTATVRTLYGWVDYVAADEGDNQ